MNDQNISVSDVAELLQISDRHVNRLAKSGIIPKINKGQYSLISVVQAYQNYLRTQVDDGEVDGLNPKKERALLAKAQREKIEIEILEKTKVLVRADDVNKAMGSIVILTRNRFKNLHYQLSSEFGKENQVIISRLKEMIVKILNDLASMSYKEAENYIDEGSSIDQSESCC